MGKQAGRQRRGPSPAMIIAVVALIVGLGGTAIAAKNNQRSKRVKLSKNSVGPRQLKRKAVTAQKIANNAINGRKVANGSLTGADIDLAQLGVVPSASQASHAGNADTVAGHAASCPSGTTLIRGVCFDSAPNGPVSGFKAASEACAARGGYLPTPMELFSTRGIINLGDSSPSSDRQFSDAVYVDDGGGETWTIAVDNSGVNRLEINGTAHYVCAYPLVR
jgi:hypothetical protein